MNAKAQAQINRMKEQTIGVEVEMNSITRKAAAKLAAEFFGTNRSEYTAHRNGYETYSAWGAQGREWKFQRDCSISGSDSEKCELVTPILHYADIETLQELIRRLRKAGAKSDYTRGCGVYIQIGAAGHAPQSPRIYEPIFSDRSHGFRPGRSCHTALTQITKGFNGIKWFIEGDIKGCFDNIDHDILLSILTRKIKDSKFINLIRKILKAGYMEVSRNLQRNSAGRNFIPDSCQYLPE